MSAEQPYIQIDTNLWAVMREPADRPVAMILGMANRDNVPLFFVMTWHPIPDRRRVIGQYDSLEAANASVLWTEAVAAANRATATLSGGIHNAAPKQK